MWCWSGYLESASQVQLSGSLRVAISKSLAPISSVLGVTVPVRRSWVSGSRVPESGVSGSQESWGLRSHGPRSQVLILDYAIAEHTTLSTTIQFVEGNWCNVSGRKNVLVAKLTGEGDRVIGPGVEGWMNLIA